MRDETDVDGANSSFMLGRGILQIFVGLVIGNDFQQNIYIAKSVVNAVGRSSVGSFLDGERVTKVTTMSPLLDES